MKSDTMMIAILEKKITNPKKSYLDIAKELNCTKQNIMYHLRMAVRLFPFLKDYIKINSSYNPGRDGLWWRGESKKLNKASEIALRLGKSVDELINRVEKNAARKVNPEVRPMLIPKVTKSISEIASKYMPHVKEKAIISNEDLSWIEKLRSTNREKLTNKLNGSW